MLAPLEHTHENPPLPITGSGFTRDVVFGSHSLYEFSSAAYDLSRLHTITDAVDESMLISECYYKGGNYS